MQTLTYQELIDFLEQNVSDLKITKQEMEYRKNEIKYHQISGMYQDYNIELKYCENEFFKIEIEKAGKEELQDLIGIISEMMSPPTLKYDLVKVEEGDCLALVEWHIQSPEDRLLDILREDVYGAGYECYNIEKPKRLKVKMPQKYGIHPRTELDMGLNSGYRKKIR